MTLHYVLLHFRLAHLTRDLELTSVNWTDELTAQVTSLVSHDCRQLLFRTNNGFTEPVLSI